MDDFDLKPQRRRSGGLFWNLMTILTLLSTICIGIYVLNIFSNPYWSFNPFPPEELPTLALFPSDTVTPIQLPATWTPTLTLEPSPTRTLAATWTNISRITPFTTVLKSLEPSLTATVNQTTTPSSNGMAFTWTINYLDSTAFHSEAGCDWMGVAGQAVDKNNNPILYLTIHLGGTLEGLPKDYRSMTGIATTYGPSGFEFVLSDHPIASTNTLWLQVLDQADLPLSNKVYFNTYSECTQNLVMVRFRKNE